MRSLLTGLKAPALVEPDFRSTRSCMLVTPLWWPDRRDDLLTVHFEPHVPRSDRFGELGRCFGVGAQIPGRTNAERLWSCVRTPN